MAGELEALARLLAERNRVDAEIAALIGRPADKGHIGEFVASIIFGIALESMANAMGIDGRFKAGPLRGRSVNVKYYAKREGTLALSLNSPPDFYLVLSGPRSAAVRSAQNVRPIVISGAYLFNAATLYAELSARPLKMRSDSTSIADEYWDRAEVFPTGTNTDLALSGDQRRLLSLFAPSGDKQ